MACLHFLKAFRFYGVKRCNNLPHNAVCLRTYLCGAECTEPHHELMAASYVQSAGVELFLWNRTEDPVVEFNCSVRSHIPAKVASSH
jgi:hypothetical protein